MRSCRSFSALAAGAQDLDHRPSRPQTRRQMAADAADCPVCASPYCQQINANLFDGDRIRPLLQELSEGAGRAASGC